MKHTIKQTVALLLATLGIALNMAVIPVSALPLPAANFAATIGCPAGETASKDGKSCTIVCPPGYTAITAAGQSVSRSCCPASVAGTTESKRPMACLFAKYLNPIINLLSAVVGLVVVIGVLFGAIQVSSSAGDPQKAANGKGHIRNALLGLLAYILLYAFLQFIIPGGSLN